MQLTYTAQLLKEGNAYVAHTPELDVSSCGDTPEEARRRLHEAIELFIEEAKRMGTLQSILEESGYRRAGDAWEPPEFIGFERTGLAFS